MKRWIRPLLLVALLVSVLTVGAAAADPTTDGIYGVSKSGVITPRDADGNLVNASDSYDQKGFYADAVKFDVTCSGLVAGEQYLLLVLNDTSVPNDSNIVYINQKAADSNGTVTFDGMDAAYPSKLEKDRTYYVYVVGEGKAFKAIDGAVASFRYYQAYELGKVNDDDFINVSDAAEVIDHFLERKTLTGQALLAANVNGDAYVNVDDAAAIIDFFLERIDSFDELMK